MRNRRVSVEPALDAFFCDESMAVNGGEIGPQTCNSGTGLPLALAVWKRRREAAFSCTELTAHATTNFNVIGQFLPVKFSTSSSESGWRVTAKTSKQSG